MTTNPLLEEIWNTKARLGAESGGDVHAFCQQVRHWSANHLPEDFKIQDASEIRGMFARQQMNSELLLREDSPPYVVKKGKTEGA